MSLLSFLGTNSEQLAQRVSLVHIALLDYNSAKNACLETIFGAGVCYLKGKGLVPLLLISKDKTSLRAGFHNIREDPNVFSEVKRAVGGNSDWVHDIFIRVLPPPEIQAQVGDRIASASFGTAGAGVTWQNGSGFLTAGHVAPQGGNVTLRGKNWGGRTKIGTTRYCGYRVGTPNSPMADVSVVETTSGQQYQSSFSGTAKAQANQSVAIHGPISGTTATIMGYCTFVHWPNTNATYGNCYFTTNHATRRGHSGSAVSTVNNGDVVGMVVGGTPNFTTYIQEMDYVLSSVPQTGTGMIGLSI